MIFPSWQQFVRDHSDKTVSRSLWFEEKQFKVFLRAGPYHTIPFGEGFHYAVGISNIVVYPEYQNSGVFRNFHKELTELAKECGYAYIRVEEVNNPILAQSLESQGYEIRPYSEPPIYTKKL